MWEKTITSMQTPHDTLGIIFRTSVVTVVPAAVGYF